MAYTKPIPDKQLIQRVRPDGRVEFLDKDTGEIKFVSKEATYNTQRKAEGKAVKRQSEISRYIWKTNKNGVPLLVLAGTNAENLPDDYQLFKYNKELALNICQQIAEGKTLKVIGKTMGYPPTSVILHWYFKDEEFREAMDNARKMRAEVYHDELVNVVETVKEKNTKSAKVKIDAFKFLMEVNDKERFGTAPKMPALENTFTFVFDTGINREQEVIDVQAESVREDNSGGAGEAQAGSDSQESGHDSEQQASQEHIDGVCAQEASSGDTQEPKEI